MIRAVLDANIYASALINAGGPPGKIIELFLKSKPFVLITSKAISEEVRLCVTYPRIRKSMRAQYSDEEVESLLSILEIESEIIEDSELSGFEISDPDDEIYLIAAVEGKANYIVSGDSDLLKIKEHDGIQIVKPRVFWDLISETSTQKAEESILRGTSDLDAKRVMSGEELEKRVQKKRKSPDYDSK